MLLHSRAPAVGIHLTIHCVLVWIACTTSTIQTTTRSTVDFERHSRGEGSERGWAAISFRFFFFFFFVHSFTPRRQVIVCAASTTLSTVLHHTYIVFGMHTRVIRAHKILYFALARSSFVSRWNITGAGAISSAFAHFSHRTSRVTNLIACRALIKFHSSINSSRCNQFRCKTRPNVPHAGGFASRHIMVSVWRKQRNSDWKYILFRQASVEIMMPIVCVLCVRWAVGCVISVSIGSSGNGSGCRKQRNKQ